MTEKNTIIVIGSGPAGIACAHALLARGLAVIMLDAGIQIADSPTDALPSLNPEDPIKLPFGSFYPYAKVNNHFTINSDKNTLCLPSFAQGGLSNAWGAVSEEYENDDLATWPSKARNIQLYYATVFSLLKTSQPKLSSQATLIWEQIKLHKAKLELAGITASPANLAAKFNDKINPCSYCGRCQRGCPQDLIYTTKHTLDELKRNPKFKYQKNIVVKKLAEEDKVTIFGIDIKKMTEITLTASQVFLACGAIISTHLARQAKNHTTPVRFSDSTHFIMPMLMHKRVRGIEKEKLTTLCQLLIKISNKQISNHTINLQLYTYMDFYPEIIEKKLGRLFKPFLPLLRPLTNRLIVVQGLLGSAESHSFSLTSQGDSSIELTSIPNKKTEIILKKLILHLKKHSKLMGLFPIKQLFKVSKVGKSFHYGCSLPMKDDPRHDESDVWGRPSGLNRIHIVDASVLPTIKAGSITPTIMANAYRIGAECKIYEQT